MTKNITINKEYKKYKLWIAKHRIYFMILDFILIIYVAFLLGFEIRFYSINEPSQRIFINNDISFNQDKDFVFWEKYAEDYNKEHSKWKLEYMYISNGLETHGNLELIKNICGVQIEEGTKKICSFIYGEKYNIDTEAVII